MTKTRAWLAAIVVLALALPAGAQDAPAQLRRDGAWLIDEHGRVVLLHGVNAVWKTPPYYPPGDPAGFTAADARWLADHGFNTARIGTLFVGVMPEEAVIDHAYLDAWDRVVQLLADHGIWVMFDFHQDMYNEEFQGEGFPNWAVKDPLTDPLPDPTFGFPGNYFSPHVGEAFDSFWSDTDGLWDHYAQAWQAVAERWRDQPYSMGYDLMNEPWPGNDWAACATPQGCPVQDLVELQATFEHVLAAIRQVDPDTLVWFEPFVMFDFGAKTNLAAVAGEDQLGLSWHDYCLAAAALHQYGAEDLPGCDVEEDLVFQNAEEAATRMQAASLLSEFGASDDLPDIRQVTELADRYLVGWQYWHYKEWSDPTTESQESGGQGMFTDDADLSSVKTDKARLLVRTYPQTTAGTPLELSFDPDSGAFAYRYTADAGIDAPTEIFTSPLHYPGGYEVVELRGARITSEVGARVLTLAPIAGADEVTIRIEAASGGGGATTGGDGGGSGTSTGGATTGGASTPVTGGGVAGLALLLALGVLALRTDAAGSASGPPPRVRPGLRRRTPG